MFDLLVRAGWFGLLLAGMLLVGRAAWPDEPKVDAPGKQQTAGDHWSFQPPRRPAVPTVKRADWVRTGIDTFVLAKLEGLGIGPSPEADRVTLIRRLSLDLLGLSPTPAEVAA